MKNWFSIWICICFHCLCSTADYDKMFLRVLNISKNSIYYVVINWKRINYGKKCMSIDNVSIFDEWVLFLFYLFFSFVFHFICWFTCVWCITFHCVIFTITTSILIILSSRFRFFLRAIDFNPFFFLLKQRLFLCRLLLSLLKYFFFADPSLIYGEISKLEYKVYENKFFRKITIQMEMRVDFARLSVFHFARSESMWLQSMALDTELSANSVFIFKRNRTICLISGENVK